MDNRLQDRAPATAPGRLARRLTLCLALAACAGVAAHAQQGPVRPADMPEQVPGAQQERRAIPPLRASPREIKLGFIDPEAVVTGTTQLTNTGDEPIRISRTASSCACTVADLEKEVLQPGESMPLEATLTAGRNLGGQQRSVRIWVDGYAMPYEVWVTAEVAYGVRANPIFVNAIGIQRTGEIFLESVDDKPFTVLSTNNETVRYVGFDPESEAPRNSYTIRYDFTGVAGADLPMWWLVETDHPRAPIIDLRVVNQELAQKNIPNPRAPWRLAEDRAILGVVAPGASAEVTIRLAGRRIEALPTLTSNHPDVTFDLVEVKPESDGVELRVRVGIRSTASGLLTPAAVIDWQDHQQKFNVFMRAVRDEGPRS
ncbi:MAG: DUF1573 domain-containing protein [Phycisphaerales bacterium]|nr:MAG: DUF1573 domain-containing protein [Phycisphaerales bacterium]